MVVADAGCGIVTILLGVGDGTFTEGGTFGTGSGGLSPYSVAVGDFNADGKLDLVTADETLNKASVLIGNGDGTFQTHVDYTTGSDSRKVVTGDFNGDGHLDFAVSSYAGVSVLLGKGDGTFQPQTFYSLVTQDHPYMLTADLNQDGMLDLGGEHSRLGFHSDRHGRRNLQQRCGLSHRWLLGCYSRGGL